MELNGLDRLADAPGTQKIMHAMLYEMHAYNGRDRADADVLN
jgi:hypothetical protein